MEALGSRARQAGDQTVDRRLGIIEARSGEDWRRPRGGRMTERLPWIASQVEPLVVAATRAVDDLSEAERVVGRFNTYSRDSRQHDIEFSGSC